MGTLGKFLTATIVVIALVALVTLLSSFQIVSAGERGLKFTAGVLDEKPLDEGLHWITPFVQRIITVDITTQKTETESNAASKDLQQVNAKIALNYHLDPDRVSDIYRNVKLAADKRIVDPAISEIIKAVTAKYTAEELVTKRDVVKQEMKSGLKDRLSPSFIVVDDLSITNFDFSEQFNRAIEDKQTAVQNALKAKNELETVKIEAEKRVSQATAEATAIKLQSEAAQSENYIKLKQIEAQREAVQKWNGKLPETFVPGSTMPFINIK